MVKNDYLFALYKKDNPYAKSVSVLKCDDCKTGLKQSVLFECPIRNTVSHLGHFLPDECNLEALRFILE